MSQSSLLNPKNNELEVIEFLLEETLPDGSTYVGHYGINVAKVLEIIRMPTVTSMPNTNHTSSLGTFNLRGKVLPLVDLGAWLGKDLVKAPTNKVLVTEFCGIQAAFLVSAVTSIHRLTWDRIEPPNRYMQSYSHSSITGFLRIEGRVLFILDMEKILATLDPSLDMSHAVVDTTPIEDADKFHLLVVDDSNAIRHIMRDSLLQSGFQVTDVPNGKEAWMFLENMRDMALSDGQKLTDHLHLIISDIEMPELDGHTLTGMIRSDPEMKDIPIILFSSLITDAVREKGERAGADRQVSKPDLPRLNQIIRELINSKLNK